MTNIQNTCCQQDSELQRRTTSPPCPDHHNLPFAFMKLVTRHWNLGAEKPTISVDTSPVRNNWGSQGWSLPYACLPVLLGTIFLFRVRAAKESKRVMLSCQPLQ